MRRAKGDGTIREYQAGKWVARITINGKEKAFYGISEREVKKKLKDFKNQVSRGLTDYKRISYEDFLEIWLKMKKLELKPQSYDRLESTVNQNVIPELGYYSLDKLDAETIQDVLSTKAKSLSYSSVKKIYDAINSSFKYARSKGVIVTNPVELVIKPNQSSMNFTERQKDSAEGIEIFTSDEIKQFVDAAHSTYSNGKARYRNSGIFLLMLNTGLRIGEACALKWTDYNVKNKTISVDASIITAKDESGKRTIKEQKGTKTKGGTRILKLNDNAIAAIPAERSGKYIFCTKDGKPLRYHTVQKMLDSILEYAGISHKTTHIFRHTFASRLFEKGYDVRVVSEILGHSNTNTTYNTYIHIIKAQKAKAMDSIDLY